MLDLYENIIVLCHLDLGNYIKKVRCTYILKWVRRKNQRQNFQESIQRQTTHPILFLHCRLIL